MSQIQDEFQYRMGLAVARFFDHASKSGLDVGELDGEVRLKLEAGKLVELTLPEERPAPKRSRKQPNEDADA